MYRSNLLFDGYFQNKIQKRMIFFGILMLIFFSQYSYAAPISDSDTISARETLIASLFWATTQIGRIIGISVLVGGFYRMRMKAEMGPNGNISQASIYMYVIVGVLMLSFSATLSSVIATLLGSDGSACFILNGSIDRATLNQGQCWDAGSSEITGTLMDRVTKMSSASTAQEFLANIKVIIGLFQLIGFIYFLVGLYGLVMVSKGTARNGYMKPIIIIAASALIVDLPHTAEIFLATLKKVGVNF